KQRQELKPHTPRTSADGSRRRARRTDYFGQQRQRRAGTCPLPSGKCRESESELSATERLSCELPEPAGISVLHRGRRGGHEQLGGRRRTNRNLEPDRWLPPSGISEQLGRMGPGNQRMAGTGIREGHECAHAVGWGYSCGFT